MIKLNKIHVHRAESWRENPGQLSGTVEFEGPFGKLEMPLDERLSQEIVSLCAEAIARAGNQVANQLTATTITETSLIEEGSQDEDS